MESSAGGYQWVGRWGPVLVGNGASGGLRSLLESPKLLAKISKTRYHYTILFACKNLNPNLVFCGV